MPAPTRENKMKITKKITVLMLFFVMGISGVLLITEKSYNLNKEKQVFGKYGFRFGDSTGLTYSIIINYRETFIKFSKDSDMVSRNRLENLNGFIFLANANGENIIIHGYLHPEIKWTQDSCGVVVDIHDLLSQIFKWKPYCGGFPATQPYQEFTLTGWEMKAPFFADEYEKKPSRSTLRPSDFE